ncbi:hypothetical protein E6H22_05390 [Candidatus Bathyarchaeota archaeon]|nr:MAG: hypothetical protein E6H22_05390 [Candidatus Bathyarchaeota archaeon]
MIVVSRAVGIPAESFLHELIEDIAMGVRKRTGSDTAKPIRNPSSHKRVAPRRTPMIENSRRTAPIGSMEITSTPIRRLKSRILSFRRSKAEFTSSPARPGNKKTALAKTNVWTRFSPATSKETPADAIAIAAKIDTTTGVEGKATRLMKLKASTVPPTPVFRALGIGLGTL